MKSKSFTLIELLVVIVIIGILAGVIMISTSSSIGKANFAKTQAFSVTVKNELLSDLVSEWTFDEQNQTVDNVMSVGSVIYDDWGNNDGLSVGSIILRSGSNCIKGKCLDMSLSNTQNVNVLNNRDIYPGTNSFTVSGWVFPRDYTYPRSFFPFGNTNASQAGGTGWQIGHGFSSDGLTVYISDGVNNVAVSINCAVGYRPIDLLNKWSYVTVVIDRNQLKAFLYINGQKQSNYLTIPSNMGDVYNVQEISLGQVMGWRLDGKLDEVVFYSKALSTSTIKANYFIGLEKLFKNGFISKEEYNERINALAYEK
ncbi:MAG: botulinum neurotoxin N-terminal receptor binding domain-containing protein [Tissierellia bacterium]|nr:botulinum neurotoxin N-terminal receptor binding domain-containing protein [Tissierellia bacterium]